MNYIKDKKTKKIVRLSIEIDKEIKNEYKKVVCPVSMVEDITNYILHKIQKKER